MTQVRFISGSPDDVAVKEIRIYHRIVQAFKTRFGKDKTTFIYFSDRFGKFVRHI